MADRRAVPCSRARLTSEHGQRTMIARQAGLLRARTWRRESAKKIRERVADRFGGSVRCGRRNRRLRRRDAIASWRLHRSRWHGTRGCVRGGLLLRGSRAKPVNVRGRGRAVAEGAMPPGAGALRSGPCCCGRQRPGLDWRSAHGGEQVERGENGARRVAGGVGRSRRLAWPLGAGFRRRGRAGLGWSSWVFAGRSEIAQKRDTFARCASCARLLYF